MVGLPAPQERPGQEGKAEPDSYFGRDTAQLNRRKSRVLGATPPDGRRGKETWLAGGPLGSSYSSISLEIFQHFSSVPTTREFA